LKNPVLLVHGGAWNIPDDMVEAHLSGVRAALDAGWAALQRGGSAVDAVEAAVVVMEDDITFDAGRGSFLTSDGRVQLDAMIMDGGTLRAGGVGCVEHIRNAVRAARHVLEDSPHVYLVGEGAERFAAAHGVELCDNKELVIDREVERLRTVQAQGAVGRPAEFFAEHDTVGAVALDFRGDIAAATSTGGTINKTPGRVGDSSLIGCGCYADNLSAAVSTTGWGEPMMKLVLAKWAADEVAGGKAPEEVAWAAMDHLKSRLGGHGGLILLGPDARMGMAHNTPRMAWGYHTAEGAAVGVDCRRS
jgi:beta-aspartyl-peptidase (threonine type)